MGTGYPLVLPLRDGTCVTLMRFEDFVRLVDERLGIDARNYVEANMAEWETLSDKVQQRIQSDLTSYESSLDSNRTAFQDIEEECRAMIGDFNRETGRNRLAALRPWRNRVESIIKIINNQI